MTDKTSVLILGCGDIGTRLALRLKATHHVFGVRRHIDTLADFITPISANLNDTALADSFTTLPPSIEHGVIIMTPQAYTDEGYRRAYIDAPQNAFRALNLNSVHVNKWWFVSSTSVYGQSCDTPIDETIEPIPSNTKASILLEAEHSLRQHHDAVSIIRSSGIYGVGRERLIRETIAGKRYPPSPPHISNRIHQDDLAGIISHLISSNVATNNIWLATDHEPTPLYDVQQWLIARLGLENTATKQVPNPRRGGSKRLINHKIIGTGYRFLYNSYREGYAHILEKHTIKHKN